MITTQDVFKKIQKTNAQTGYDGDFSTDVFEALGISDNPKKWDVFNLAWEYGHSYGYSEVWNYLMDLADLIK